MNASISGSVSNSVPLRLAVSQAALEPTYRCMTILSFSVPANKPDGTQKQGVFLSGFGKVEPQVLQKYERNPVGNVKVEISPHP